MNVFTALDPPPNRDLGKQTQKGYILADRVEKGQELQCALSLTSLAGQHEDLGLREGSRKEGGRETKGGWPWPFSQMSGPPPRL